MPDTRRPGDPNASALEIATPGVDGHPVADHSSDIVIVGAGVLGLCVAVELAGRGRDVCVIDPGGANASSVAAGMIAPAFESLTAEGDPDRAALFRDAAALWPDTARRLGIALDTTPAIWRGAEAPAVAARLRALGFDVQQDADRVEAPGDVRVDPAEALAAMIARLPRPVLSARALDGRATDRGWSLTTTAGPVTARQLILATGAAAALPGLPPGIAALIDTIEPIAGQIGRALHPPGPGGVRRGPDGYVVAARDHWLIGATMVAGSRDPTPDPDQSRRLEAVAERLLDRPLDGPVAWTGGIRGSTADGLPLAGPAGVPGLHLALAPRRNGWLLGPLVGRMVADGIEGRPHGAHTAALDPLRFSRPAG